MTSAVFRTTGNWELGHFRLQWVQDNWFKTNTFWTVIQLGIPSRKLGYLSRNRSPTSRSDLVFFLVPICLESTITVHACSYVMLSHVEYLIFKTTIVADRSGKAARLVPNWGQSYFLHLWLKMNSLLKLDNELNIKVKRNLRPQFMRHLGRSCL